MVGGECEGEVEGRGRLLRVCHLRSVHLLLPAPHLQLAQEREPGQSERPRQPAGQLLPPALSRVHLEGEVSPEPRVARCLRPGPGHQEGAGQVPGEEVDLELI